MPAAALKQFRPTAIGDTTDLGAVVRAVNQRFRDVAESEPTRTPVDVFNLLDFGADLNNSVRTTNALQRGLRKAAEEGGALWVPPTVWEVEDECFYDSYVTLFGVRGVSALEMIATLDKGRKILTPNGATISATFRDLILNQRGDIYASDDATWCHSVSGTTDCVVAHVQHKNSVTMALYADAPSTAPTTGLRVLGGWVNSSAAGGDSFFGTMEDVEVVGRRYTSCKDDALAFQDSGRGQPVGITVLGGRFLNNNRRTVTPKGTSAPHAMVFQGCKDVYAVAPSVDTTCAEGILAVRGGSGYACENVNVIAATVRNAGVTPDDTTGVPGSGVTYRGVTGGSLDGQFTQSRERGWTIEDSTDVSVSPTTRSWNNAASGGAVVAVTAPCTRIRVAGKAQNNGTGGVETAGLRIESTDVTNKVDDLTLDAFRATGHTDALHFVGANTGTVKDIGGTYDGNTNEVGGVAIAGYVRSGVTGATKTFIVAKSANYVATGTEGTITMDASAAPRTVTLPSAASCLGVPLTIKKSDASINAVTVAGTVDGVASPTLAAQYKSMTVVSDGTNWNKIASV